MQTQNTTYCAFLRGVNVKGTNMKMADVCLVFEKAGMHHITSVLASGNIIFSAKDEQAPETYKSHLKSLLEKAMADHFDYEAFLFIKAKTEVEALVFNNPFTSHPDFHIYGFVGIDGIENTLMTEYDKSNKTPGEEGLIIAKNFYWKVPKGNTLGSEFGKILGHKNLKNSFTSRNLNTFEKVLKKM